MATDADGNVYCLSYLHTGGNSVHLTKLNSASSVVWHKSYNNEAERPTIVLADNDGNVTVITASTTDYYRMVEKYRTDGSLVWHQEWTEADEWLPIDAGIDLLGNYYLVDTALFVSSYDPDGDFRWRRQIGSQYSASWGQRLMAKI